ncbi:MAG TPA: PAS domain-containing protein [Hypericibacter adhaerens]|jgi:PAS domain S-box-containing protein|uniref:PAS domain-containing protein n=1 Tax=Hypericibacter adhaerens TaxID=2602016 RepID=UPI002C446813|nr:PAS domain-containing protein [Hypericibacter adhaerens]HWA46147.1 PAS domain-containing protein [Hypericibacter adhaerens]
MTVALAAAEPLVPRQSQASRKLAQAVSPTNVERRFEPHEIIVSKTDLKGRLTYVNRTFMAISDFNESELLGQPHSLIRHPDMPRCVFKLLWDTIQARKEIFAYVKNMTKTGDHYWVLAHVTPSLGASGEILGYHSSRRLPERRIVEGAIVPLYRELAAIENAEADRKRGLDRSWQRLQGLLKEKGVAYDQFVFSL